MSDHLDFNYNLKDVLQNLWEVLLKCFIHFMPQQNTDTKHFLI